MKIPQRQTDLNLLLPSVRPTFEKLERRIEALKLPMVRYETQRTAERQAYLYAKGRSGPQKHKPKVTWAKHSEHQNRKAVDYILDFNPNHKGFWYTGLSPDRKWVEDAWLFREWLLFGAMVEAAGLTWGGRWRQGPGQLLGFDPFHVQFG